MTPWAVAAGIGFALLGAGAERLAAVWPPDEASRSGPGPRTAALALLSSVGAGRYRLLLTADAGGWFTEVNEANNSSWVDIQLKGGNAPPKITGYGSQI